MARIPMSFATARSVPALVALLLLACTVTACIAPDEPMVLSAEDDAVEEGDVMEATTGEEAAVAVEEVDADALGTGEPPEETSGETADATATPDGVAAVPKEGATSDEGLAAEIGFSDVLVSSNYFINREVEDLNGDVIADVDDVLLDLNTGRILYVVINYGDFLDLTDEDRPMPLSAFGWNQELELVLRLPEEVLESVPAVEDEWPAFEDTAWNDSLLTYWQERDFSVEIDPEAVPVRVSELIGLHAGQLGAELGVIEDILLDLNREQVAYIGIFAADGFYDPDMVLLVPIVAADLTVEAVDSEAFYGVTLLEIDPEVLRAAPALDRSIFASVDFIDQSFTQELNTYWREQGLDVGTEE